MAAAACSLAFAGALRPQPEITVSQWADGYRIISKPSPEPGLWRTERVPYIREIQDNLSPCSPVNITGLMKAAQGAGSEAGLNALGCWMHRYPDDIIIALPTTNVAKKFVRTRLEKMIDACPSLRDLVDHRSRAAANSVFLKEYGPGRDNLTIVGANSGNELRSTPARRGIMDEVDGCEADLDHEGSPDELLLQRLAAYHDFKLYLVSTPTLEDISLIHRWFLKGDQRLFHIPCPLCRREQALVFGEDRVKSGQLGGLRWPKGRPDEVRYQCEHCGDGWEEWRKVEALQRGVWIPSAPGHDRLGDIVIRTYQINALYYPYGWPGNAWVNLAAKWESDHKDPVKRKSFINLKLATPYKDPSEAKADADTLLARCEAYGPEIPAGAAVLTFGADVQANRIEVELVAWGKDEESWSMDGLVFLGDTSKLTSNDRDHPSPWEQLDQWRRGEWLSELGIPLRISAGCVDAGYQTQVVTQWCGERFSQHIWATIGRAGNRPVWPKKPGRSRVVKAPVFVLGVDSAKENVYARLKLAQPGPGFPHFPKGRDRDWFEQLTAEIRVPDYTGPIPKFVWRKKTAGARNEALDCRTNAYGALCGLVAGGLRLNPEVDRLRRMAQEQSRPVEIPERRISIAAPAPTGPVYSSDPYLS